MEKELTKIEEKRAHEICDAITIAGINCADCPFENRCGFGQNGAINFVEELKELGLLEEVEDEY